MKPSPFISIIYNQTLSVHIFPLYCVSVKQFRTVFAKRYYSAIDYTFLGLGTENFIFV